MNFVMSFLNGEGALNRLQFLSRMILLSVLFLLITVGLTMAGVDPIKASLIMFPVHMALIYPLVKARLNSFDSNSSLTPIWIIGLLIPGVNLLLLLILLFKSPHRDYTRPDRALSPALIIGILFSFIMAYSGVV